MSSFRLDKEKYVEILKAEGASAALTALHKDTIQWEYQAFEGEKGYQPDLWEALHAVRDFSRELWEIALQNPTSEKHSA